MPEIELKDLNHSIGTELFADDESFLEDLNDVANIIGGVSVGEAAAASTSSAFATNTVAISPRDVITTSVYYPNPIWDRPVATITLNPHPVPPRHRRPIDHGFTATAFLPTAFGTSV
jgi:hypothetical protein